MDESGDTGNALVFHAKGFICWRKEGRVAGKVIVGEVRGRVE